MDTEQSAQTAQAAATIEAGDAVDVDVEVDAESNEYLDQVLAETGLEFSKVMLAHFARLDDEMLQLLRGLSPDELLWVERTARPTIEEMVASSLGAHAWFIREEHLELGVASVRECVERLDELTDRFPELCAPRKMLDDRCHIMERALAIQRSLPRDEWREICAKVPNDPMEALNELSPKAFVHYRVVELQADQDAWLDSEHIVDTVMGIMQRRDPDERHEAPLPVVDAADLEAVQPITEVLAEGFVRLERVNTTVAATGDALLVAAAAGTEQEKQAALIAAARLMQSAQPRRDDAETSDGAIESTDLSTEPRDESHA